jgi:geranylgeranyl diphosphate synthase, type I
MHNVRPVTSQEIEPNIAFGASPYCPDLGNFDSKVADIVERFHQSFAGELTRWSTAEDELTLDNQWLEARKHIQEFTMRPGKRVRPSLVALGYLLAQPRLLTAEIPMSVVQFSVGIELLHTFMLVHDDVADRAETRRGGQALHLLLGAGRLGEDLAIVAGDHLYARAFEAMFSSPVPSAAKTAQYMLKICRHTAVGQHLDLTVSATPLAEVTLFQTLKIAQLKTARYGFVAPLVCGARLGGAGGGLVQLLERLGRMAGLAYQLQDDLIGLFGNDALAGKLGGADFFEGKRTFPLLAAWTRADEVGRQRLEKLWQHKNPAQLFEAREAVRFYGGVAATQRVIARMTRNALKVLRPLQGHEALSILQPMLTALSERVA